MHLETAIVKFKILIYIYLSRRFQQSCWVQAKIDNQTSPFHVDNHSKSNNSQENSIATHHKFLTSYFLSVDEEITTESDQYGDHELQLIMEYKAKELENDDELNNKKEKKPSKDKEKSISSQALSDGYEKVVPKHGDVLLHKMISTIKRNPGQVLRYTLILRQFIFYLY